MFEELSLPRDAHFGGRLLDEWLWLLREPHEVIRVTMMGDAFVRSASGAVLFLDTLEGNLKPVASSEQSFEHRWSTGDLDPDWFNEDMLMLLKSRGSRLEHGQCYSYDVPPIIGGPLESTNVSATDAVVHFSVTGQLHRQVRDLPDGTQIAGFTVKD